MESVEAIEGSLTAYDRALLLVSHDESFIANVGINRRIAVRILRDEQQLSGGGLAFHIGMGAGRPTNSITSGPPCHIVTTAFISMSPWPRPRSVWRQDQD